MIFNNMITSLVKKYPNIVWTEFDSPWLNRGEYRLDGSFYCDSDLIARIIFESTNYKKVHLSNFLFPGEDWKKQIFLPNRSSRVYVDQFHGIPYFSGSDILMAYPVASAYLANSHKTVSSTLIKQNWLLVSARGTVGNITIAGKRMNNTCASDNIIRVCVSEDQPFGFIYAFFRSRFGRAQFRKNTYGAVVDAISAKHVASISVPLLNLSDIHKIHKDISHAFSLRNQANDLIDESQELFYEFLNLPKISIDDVQHLVGKKVKAWEINEFGFENRFDGSFYYPLADLTIEKLKESKYPISILGNKKLVQKVFMPGRFRRIYVKKGFGIPFLSGKNIIQSTQDDIRFLAKTKDVESYIIKIGWVLITRSGTIGRTSLVTKQWDNFAATEHIIRIIPKDIDSGYLITFLHSNYGQNQIKRFIHGSIVDEISENQIMQIVIPVPEKDIQIQIGEKAQKAFELRAKANEIEEKAIEFLEEKIKESI